MADMTRVGMSVRGAEVVTVPIDDTLMIEGQAADAKATGDALALKADKSELQAAVKVNNQPADAQGLILIDGRHIPVSDEDAETLAEAVTDLKGQTAENIPMSSDSGAKTIAEVVNANAEAIESMEEMTGATMPIESGSQTTVKAAIEARVKTVNRKAPDADGDVDLSVVPLAENLQSDKMESVEGAFIIRTTGGNASVSDGKAYPLHLFGAAEHTGYVAEELNMTVIPITRTEPDEPITATIDRDTFVAYVDESSTINLYYTTEWSADPELYGITVTGTPVAGDQITVVYVKEVRGTITVANPARLVGTGWNLFDYNNGYARVVKYSTEYGYKIGGSYASLQFSATLTGERSSITPGVDGLFNVPSDGYVFVTGGNNTDTYILTTWSDWMEGPSSGYWEPYRESGIDLSAVMTTYFPNGLLAVGTTSDEIDLSAKRSISRIERMAYSEENRAAAAASGRSYDFDQNYIYIVRESAVISAITIDTTYNVSEHGLEWFTETTLPVISEILYGKNLRDKLERDVVTISAQTLTEEEKAQVRTNIGAMSQADGDKKLVAPTTAGTNGQLLQTNGDGTTKWTTQGTPTDAQVGTAVSAWLTAHPEATTTVQDGAISRAKLNDDLKAKTDAVPDLKSAFNNFPTGLEKVLNDRIGVWYKGYYQTQNTGTAVNYVDHANYVSTIIPVDDANFVTLNASSDTGINRVYVFVDSNFVSLGRSGNNLTGERVVGVPQGAKYMLINNNITIQASGYYAYIGDTVPYRIEFVENKLSESTNNLFKGYGDIPIQSPSDTGYVNIMYLQRLIDFLPAGTYSVRMKMDSEADEWMISFGSDETYNSSTTVYSYRSTTKNVDVTFTFTTSVTIKSIFVFSSTSVSDSSGKIATIKDFTIISGSTPPKYNYPDKDAYDHKSRYMIALLESITGGITPTGDTTDRKAEIEAKLTSGSCLLSPGNYYVSGIDMPDGATLQGSGRGTYLILLDSVTIGCAVKMGSHCVVKDMTIIGSSTDIVFTDGNIDSIHLGTRHGILWKGEATGSTSTSENNTHFEGIISNCFFKGFTGGAITCETTGYGTDAGVTVDNCHMNNCGAGINIAWWSEFNRFNNCNCNGCYYGVINNGGNNSFSNCNFSSNNVGFYINGEDNKCILADGITVKTLRNGGHGQVVGCIIDHTGLGENLNSGYSVYIRKLDSGWMFDGCQIFYGKIYLNNSSHTMFVGINFGSDVVLLIYNIYGTNQTGTVIVANSYVRTGSSGGIKAYVYDTDGNIVPNNAYGEDGNLPRAKFLNVYRFNGELKNLLSIAVSE